MFAVLAEAAVKRGEGEVRGEEEAKAEGASAKRTDRRVGRVDVEGRARLGPSNSLRPARDRFEISTDLELVAGCPLAFVA